MSKTSAQVKARYNAKTYDKLYTFIPKGLKEPFKAACERNSESMSAVITKAVKDYININFMEVTTMSTIKNRNGVELNFEAAARLMDDELRETLHMEMAPCSDQEFFTAYEDAHEKEFDEEWALSGRNPQW